MLIDTMRTAVTRRPGWIVGFWVVLAVAVGLGSPDLTRLAAEGQAHLLDEDSESARGADLIRQAWPDQSFESQAVISLTAPRDFRTRIGPSRGSSPTGSS